MSSINYTVRRRRFRDGGNGGDGGNGTTLAPENGDAETNGEAAAVPRSAVAGLRGLRPPSPPREGRHGGSLSTSGLCQVASARFSIRLVSSSPFVSVTPFLRCEGRPVPSVSSAPPSLKSPSPHPAASSTGTESRRG